MRRQEKFKQFDVRTRNKIRAILSQKNGNAIQQLDRLRSKFGRAQIDALEGILNDSALTNAAKSPAAFPKNPPFTDNLNSVKCVGLIGLLSYVDTSARRNLERLERLAASLKEIDELYSERNFPACLERVVDALKKYGWSHALLRRIILIRENTKAVCVDIPIDELVAEAGITGVVVSSLIHAFASDQSILMIKRSILNIPDRGTINRYTRTISKLAVQPLATSAKELEDFLREVVKCSLIDAVILAKYNSHLFSMNDYQSIARVAQTLGQLELFEPLLATYDASDSEGEYLFYKQSSAWLEYEPVRQYRLLIDNFYDASLEQSNLLPVEIDEEIQLSVGGITPADLVIGSQFTRHHYTNLAELELSGNVTRSALFNYWLSETKGEVAFDTKVLLALMGKTRDLSRTVPIEAVRTASKLANDELVKLILLLLLVRRSKNEHDSFKLRKLFTRITAKYYEGSLVKLVEAYEVTHPYVAEYIYDITTEDFLARLIKLVPHLADIPEIRASLHEWMARFTNDEHYLQRARTVRIDHQINRVRDEIDDHRIYVDPSRFSSWIEDEMMMELSSALNSAGHDKKAVPVACDETVISLVMTQCYNAFCSNSVFGIASYIGRRIRHGTFHGFLYSNLVNTIEQSEKYLNLFQDTQFRTKWSSWKETYNKAIEEIITERLHIYSKNKPQGLLTPETFGVRKQEVLKAAVTAISKSYSESMSTSGLDELITEYCWRLAELDLGVVIRYIKDQQTPLKNKVFLEEELFPAALSVNLDKGEALRRDLEILLDRKISTILGWFKRPTIVAPKASVSLLFAATVAEAQDSFPEFDPQDADSSEEEIELVGAFYHLVYDALAIVVGNAAKYSDLNCPLKRKFEIVPGREKRLIIEVCSTIKPGDDPNTVSESIESRKNADFHDANMYDRKSGISKLMLLANNREDFELEQYSVVGKEVIVRLIYVLEH